MSFMEILEDLVSQSLKEENISIKDLELVDLEMGFSPVIAIKGGTFNDAVNVIQCQNQNKYIVNHPLFKNAVNADELKIMRFRYLKSRQYRI